jgi:hypothetical protein
MDLGYAGKCHGVAWLKLYNIEILDPRFLEITSRKVFMPPLKMVRLPEFARAPSGCQNGDQHEYGPSRGGSSMEHRNSAGVATERRLLLATDGHVTATMKRLLVNEQNRLEHPAVLQCETPKTRRRPRETYAY